MKLNLVKIVLTVVPLGLIGFLFYSSNISTQSETNTVDNVSLHSNSTSTQDQAQNLASSSLSVWSAQYIHPIEWPPKTQLLNQPFACVETGTGTTQTQGGQTKKQTIDGREYCATKESEGAAGSTYTNYTYLFSSSKDTSKTISLMFTLRAVQCANYNDPQKTACEKERASFDIDMIIDQIARVL